MSNCVYVAHALTTSYYKIGITTNIEKRLHGLQTVIPFFDIEIIATHYHDRHRDMERLLHRIYADKQLRTSEWFDLTSADLSTVLMSTADLANRLGLNNNKVDLHKLFPPKSSLPEIIEHEVFRDSKGRFSKGNE